MRYAKPLIGTLLIGAGLALCADAAMAAEPRLDWLAGHWCGGEGGQRVDEVWLSEAGGGLLGMSRTVEGDSTRSFEFMRIGIDAEGASFNVQPNGAPATVFAQADAGTQRIRFENPAHDFPNRIEYWREGERLKAYIAGPGRDGKELKIPFEYRRCDL